MRKVAPVATTDPVTLTPVVFAWILVVPLASTSDVWSIPVRFEPSPKKLVAVTLPPTWRFLSIPTPPSTVRAPVPTLVD